MVSFSGADNEIRTHDLVITNDVLCQLSYISTTSDIISKDISFVNNKMRFSEARYPILITRSGRRGRSAISPALYPRIQLPMPR